MTDGEQGNRDGAQVSSAEAALELFTLLRRFVDASESITDAVAHATALHRTDAAAVLEISGAAAAGQPLSAITLRRKLRLSPPATTALIDRLERTGHVLRQRDPDDRRRVLLTLTPRGGDVVAAMLPALAAALTRAVDGYRGQDHRLVIRYLRDIVEAVESVAERIETDR